MPLASNTSRSLRRRVTFFGCLIALLLSVAIAAPFVVSHVDRARKREAVIEFQEKVKKENDERERQIHQLRQGSQD